MTLAGSAFIKSSFFSISHVTIQYKKFSTHYIDKFRDIPQETGNSLLELNNHNNTLPCGYFNHQGV